MTVILIILINAVLWILRDTITEILSGGKSFAPNELKSF
jgi:hypothetical protein